MERMMSALAFSSSSFHLRVFSTNFAFSGIISGFGFYPRTFISCTLTFLVSNICIWIFHI